LNKIGSVSSSFMHFSSLPITHRFLRHKGGDHRGELKSSLVREAGHLPCLIDLHCAPYAMDVGFIYESMRLGVCSDGSANTGRFEPQPIHVCNVSSIKACIAQQVCDTNPAHLSKSRIHHLTHVYCVLHRIHFRAGKTLICNIAHVWTCTDERENLNRCELIARFILHG
jgi:hypothetical protein